MQELIPSEGSTHASFTRSSGIVYLDRMRKVRGKETWFVFALRDDKSFEEQPFMEASEAL